MVIERAKKTTIDLSLHFKKTSVSHEESTSEYSSTAVSSDEDSELELQFVRSDASERVGTPLSSLLNKGKENSTDGQHNKLVSLPSVPDGAAKKLEAHNVDGHMSSNLQARLDKFHAFQWFVAIPHEQQSSRYAFSDGLEENVSSSPLPEKSNARSFDVDLDRLKSLFSEMHKTIRTTSGRVRRPYNKCPSRSLEEVEVRLAKLLQKRNEGSVDAGSQRNVGSSNERQTGLPTGIPDSDDQIRHQSARTESITNPLTEENIRSLTEGDIRTLDSGLNRQKRRLVINAKRCFVFFLPLEYSSDMVSKYWGAVYSMIDVSRDPTR